MFSLDQVDYLLLQLEAILSIVPMVFVKLTIFVFISSEGVSLDFPRPLYKFFILNFHEYPGNGSIERW